MENWNLELAPTLGTWPAQALSLELWNLELEMTLP